MQRLDIFAAPLAGISLIEASAGTGKTYTITGLYLRLVVEAERPVRRILVVTYTKAATEELRERIRQRLVVAREAFVKGSSQDAFCQRLIEQCQNRQLALRRITNAIRGFDEAAIFTIHGFCLRALADSAFESGMPFEIDLLADERDMLQEVVDDFWRREFYGAAPLLVNYLLDKGYSPEKLFQEVRSHVGRPYSKVLRPTPVTDYAAAEQAFARAYTNVRELWQSAQQEIQDLLCNSTSLNGNKYRSTSMPGWLALLANYLAPQTPNVRLFDKFEKFTASQLAVSVKAKQAPPQHAFFVACDELFRTYNELAGCCRWYLLELRTRLLVFCNSQLEMRKHRQRVQSYDDLLSHLLKGLRSEQGEELAKVLRERYAAALIDEFQDTDPVQYAIFRHIYAGTKLPVFLVGDPKQAIYSFRGADIFAYLAARRDAVQHYTLDVNWRSDPRLLQAFNTLFTRSAVPFLFAAIPFQPAEAANQFREPLLIQDRLETPLRFWFLGGADNEGVFSKGQAAEFAARATAAEIARLLNLGALGKARIGERSLEGGDIAVLVRNHRQARLVRRQLIQLGVPSVQQAQDNVFATQEAQELEWLLMAVAEPVREPLVRAALATTLLGMSGEALYCFSENEKAWEERLENFHEYHRLWRDHGFIPMFRTLLQREQVAQRLLNFRDGERQLTNVLHLAELLQGAASRGRAGMEGLLKWLSERRRSQATEDEEQQLRLESDEHLVKLVTVHKSKGLEYPIVFCPFLWDGRLWSNHEESLRFHDPADPAQVCLDLGSERQNENRFFARTEESAENLRLLYVALTRARYHCYVVWGAIHEAGTSAPAWLLHRPAVVGSQEDPVVATAERVKALREQVLWQELEAMASCAGGTVSIHRLPLGEAMPYQPPWQPEPQLQPRQFTKPAWDKWSISSFTSLSEGGGVASPHYAGESQPDEPSSMTDSQERTVATLPRGARVGSCLHLIFERLDFTLRDRSQLEALVERALFEYGIASEWVSVVTTLVERVLMTPLQTDGLRLAQVTLKQRLNELAFYYPVVELAPEGLRQILASYGISAGLVEEQSEDLGGNGVRGYLKGFIDLVFESQGRFYLVDYKSNWLGEEPTAYRTERLAEVMVREAYCTQYLLYTVALHRYLQLRLPDYDYERHFGGVFYLFLRGMDPALGSEYGIFRERPPWALVNALNHYFASGAY